MKNENGFWYCLNCREEKLPEIINICDNCGHPIEWIVTHPPQTDEDTLMIVLDCLFSKRYTDAMLIIEQALNKKG